jgi:hypothetical protein
MQVGSPAIRRPAARGRSGNPRAVLSLEVRDRYHPGVEVRRTTSGRLLLLAWARCATRLCLLMPGRHNHCGASGGTSGEIRISCHRCGAGLGERPHLAAAIARDAHQPVRKRAERLVEGPRAGGVRSGGQQVVATAAQAARGTGCAVIATGRCPTARCRAMPA